MIIEEDYVSFETAKLLKAKGFDNDVIRTDYWYDEDGDLHRRGNYSYSGAPIYHKDTCCNAPTLQMAMKWLRELHNLHCDISYHFRLGWHIEITSLKETVIDHNTEMKTYPIFNTIDYSSYEEGCEDAIRYCLKELI